MIRPSPSASDPTPGLATCRFTRSLLVGLLVGLPFGWGSGEASGQEGGDIYERGAALVQDGRWEDALDVWAAASDAFIGTGRSDPRIGVAFLETAVAEGATERLTEASRLFLWGLSGNGLDEFRDAIVLEARRAQHLLTPRDSARWEPYVEGDTDALARHVARYWLEHDPTPESDLNERLVEHWQRITEARDRYRYNTSSVYDTDDRGVIFVKYGPPDTRTNGSLGTNEMELKIRVDDARAREAMRRYDTNPQFELWKYGQLHPEEFTYYLFGNIDGTGPFELVDGPLDLINPSARSLASVSVNPGGVRMQHYLELFYYRDLAVLGGRFGARFDELSSLWDGYTMRRNAFGANGRPAPTAPTLESFSIRYEQEDKYFPEGVPTIPIRSDFEGASRGMEMVIQPVRVLDPNNQPMVVIQALSAPRVRFTDGRRRTEYVNPLRDTDHTLVLRSEALVEAGRLTQRAPARIGGISVFRLRHPPQPMHLTVYGEALGNRSDDADTLSLAGQAHAYLEEPLTGDPTLFEVSDIATGTPLLTDDFGEALPFPLLPATKIWTRDALRVYLELYHLSPDGTGRGQYDLQFRLTRLDDVGVVDDTIDPVTLGIQLEAQGSRAQHSFDIGMAGLLLGPYRLEVDATDLVSGATKRRTAEIEIIG